MKIDADNDKRSLGFKFAKSVILTAALVGGVMLVFALGSYAGKFFGKFMDLLN